MRDVEHHDENDLHEDANGNHQPRRHDPAARHVELPHAGQHGKKHRAQHHEKQFFFQVGVLRSQHPKERVRESRSNPEQHQRKDSVAAENLPVTAPEQLRLLHARETWVNNVAHHRGQHREDDRKPSERADLRHARRAAENADEPDGELPLHAIINGIGRLIAHDGEDGSPIFLVRRRLRIRHGRHPAAQHEFLQGQADRGGEHRDGGVKKNSVGDDEQNESQAGGPHIQILNAVHFEVQTWHGHEHSESELKIKSEQHDYCNERTIREGRSVVPQHPEEQRRDQRHRHHCEDPPQPHRRRDQLAEAKAVLPHSATDGGDAAADAVVGHEVHRRLHCVGNGKQRVVGLRKYSDEENAAGKRESLHNRFEGKEARQQFGPVE